MAERFRGWGRSRLGAAGVLGVCMDQRTRYRGAMLGLAAGDALGTTLEFQRPGSFEPLTDMVGGGPFDLQPGEWTDDTSMALCLAESLLASGGSAPRDQLARYVRWRQKGYWSSNGRCFDIGGTVSTALHRFEETGDPYPGGTDTYSAGNGSLMRLAPVPLYFAANPEEAVAMAAASSRTTHAVAPAVDACRYYCGLMLGALQDADKDELLGSKYEPVEGIWARSPLCLEIDEIAGGSFRRRMPPEIKGSGYVVRSMEAALWAFWHGSSFQEGCLLAANLGADADTTAAIYGQLAGCFYGEGGIPRRWRNKLARRGEIEELADGLWASASERMTGERGA